jgi:hypothetical protein
VLDNNTFEQILLSIAPLVTLVFALGEQFGWWDKLTGRSKALEGLERLYSAEGYPKTYIRKDKDEDEAVFRALERRISPRTSDEPIKNLICEGIHPHSITVVGQPIQITGLEPKMKNFVMQKFILSFTSTASMIGARSVKRLRM